MKIVYNKTYVFDMQTGDALTGIITVDFLNHKIIPNNVMSIQTLYSIIKLIWKDDSDLAIHPIPLLLIGRISDRVNTMKVEINGNWSFDWSYVYGFTLE